MTLLDLIALGVVALAALGGAARGLASSGLSLAGLAGGAVLGSRAAPYFLARGAHSPYAPLPSLRGPPLPSAPPNRGVLREPGTRRAAPSVVKILGTACGLGIEGSGWVAEPGLVVTNAHVVAGESDTTVTPLAGPTLPARA